MLIGIRNVAGEFELNGEVRSEGCYELQILGNNLQKVISRFSDMVSLMFKLVLTLRTRKSGGRVGMS